MNKQTGSRSWLEIGVAVAAVTVLGLGALVLADPAYAGGDTDCGAECVHECEFDGGCITYYQQAESITMVCDDGDVTLELLGTTCAN